MVVGYTANSTFRSVALLLLQNLRAGAQFSMTDNAFTGSEFKTTEGEVTFTASAVLPRGTVLVWYANAAGWTTSSTFAISASGDNIVLFSGSLTAPSRFHYALTYNIAFDAPSSALQANQCALPESLARNRTALELPRSRAGRYSGPTAGSREELLAAISDPSRWTQSEAVVLDLAALPAFNVRDGNSEPTAKPIAPPTAAPPTAAPPTAAPPTVAPAPPTSSPSTSPPPSLPTSFPSSSRSPNIAPTPLVTDTSGISPPTAFGLSTSSPTQSSSSGLTLGVVFSASAVVTLFVGWRLSAPRSAQRLSQRQHGSANPLYNSPDIAPHNKPWQASPMQQGAFNSPPVQPYSLKGGAASSPPPPPGWASRVSSSLPTWTHRPPMFQQVTAPAPRFY